MSEALNKRNYYATLLFGVAFISSAVFNGEHIFYLSLLWLSLMLLTVYLILNKKTIRLKLGSAPILIVLFVGWMVIAQQCWHPVPWVGALYNWRFAVYFFVMYLVYSVFQEQQLKDSISVIKYIGFAIAIVTLVQTFALGHEPTGLSINKNNNAALMNLFLLPLLATMLMRNDDETLQPGSSLVFAIILSAIVQISSRGALISLAISAAILFTIAAYQRKKKNILFVSVYSCVVLAANYIVLSAQFRTDFHSPSRWHLLNATIDMIRDAGWHGIGNGMFLMRYPVYRSVEDKSGGIFVHNDYLQILLELGIPGFLLLLLMMSVVTIGAYRLLKNHYGSSKNALQLGMFVGILAVSIHSLVTFNFYKSGILFVMGVYAGAIMKKSVLSGGGETPSYVINLNRGRKFIIAALLFAIIQPLIFVGYADAINDGLVSDELSMATPEKQLNVYRQLERLDPSNYAYPYLIANVYSVLGSDESPEKRRERFANSSQQLHRAEKLNPYAFEVYIYEASLMHRFSDIIGPGWGEQAIPLALKGLNLNPRRIDSRLRVAKMLDAYGDKERALSLLNDGLVYLTTEFDNKRYLEFGKSLSEAVDDRYSLEKYSDLIVEDMERAKKEQAEMIEEYKSSLN